MAFSKEEIQVSIVKSDGLERQIQVSLPAENFNHELQERLKEAARTVKVDGFRQGKVPMAFIEKRFGADIRKDVTNELMRSSIADAVEKVELQAVSMPRFEPTEFTSGQPFVYCATFEILPKFEVKTLKGIEFEKPIAKIVEEDINTTLEKLRQQHTEWGKVDRKAREGDKVIIDFKGFINNEPFPHGEATEFPLELGSKSMIPGFEDALLGVNPGENKTIKVTFPEDYHHKEMAGKEATFEITVHHVEESKLPELNDDFAKKFNVKEGNIEALRQQIRTFMENELNTALQEKIKQKVFNKLLELNEFELPKALINQEVEELRRDMQKRFDKSGNVPRAFPRTLFEEQAKRRVKLGLLLSEIIKLYSLKAEPDKVRKIIEERAALFEHSEQVIEWYYKEKEHLQQIESLVLENQTIEKMLEEAKIKEKENSYEEIIQGKSDSVETI